MEADYLREQESESAGARGFSQLVNGMNVYRVEVVRLKDRNADKVFEKLQRKISRGKTLGRHDVFPLLLTPLMSGKMEMSQRIYQGMEFLQCKELKAGDEDRKRMQSVLYALAVKFLDRDELAMIKERIGMTVLGKMLFEDGVEKGIEKGIEQGIFRSDVNFEIINLLVREQGNILMNTNLRSAYSFVEVYESIMFVYMRGISTERGQEILENFIKEYRSQK